MRTEDFFTDDDGRKVAPEAATRLERRIFGADGELVRREFYTVGAPTPEERERAIEQGAPGNPRKP